MPIEDSEMEPLPLTPGEQAEGEAVTASLVPFLEPSTEVHRGSGEALEDMIEITAIPDNCETVGAVFAETYDGMPDGVLSPTLRTL